MKEDPKKLTGMKGVNVIPMPIGRFAIPCKYPFTEEKKTRYWCLQIKCSLNLGFKKIFFVIRVYNLNIELQSKSKVEQEFKQQ